jgi:hypothetical protein
MLLPRSYALTPIQRWLIAAGVALFLVALGTLVYTYERYHRGPGESAFYGTWLDPMFAYDEISYWEFRSDHTFTILMLIDGEKKSMVEGRCYALTFICAFLRSIPAHVAP